MNSAEVMHEYNLHERQSVQSVGGETVSSSKLVKFVSKDRYGSYISYFDLKEEEASEVIADELAYYKQRGLNFEWKTYSSDTPHNIVQLLLEQGFEQADTESFMALDLANVESEAVNSPLIVKVDTELGIRDAVSVQEQVWGGSFEWQYNYLINLKQQSPDSISIYVIYEDSKPVTSAWLTFNGDSPFAGIWGGSTVKEYRGKGHYSLLLNKRIQEAKQRGKQYLIIDASEMSRPIVEKHGFEFVAHITGFNSPEL